MSLRARLICRLYSARRGSVLILVVALLLLMAIIGTAFISSSRTDRYSAVQHNTNTQIDLLLQGTENLVYSAVLGKLYTSDGLAGAPSYFRYAASSLGQYVNIDSPATDLYLASRSPEYYNDNFYDAQPYQNVFWPSLSYPPVTANPAGTLPYAEYDGVDGGRAGLIWYYNTTIGLQRGDVVVSTTGPVPEFFTPTTPSPLTVPSAIDGNWRQVDPKAVFAFIPTVKTIGTSTVPGLLIYNRIKNQYINPAAAGVAPLPGNYTAPAAITAANVIMAVDSDGDGIADAGLFKLPVGQIDGVTYYAGLRVIDNNSAINASTAWSSSYDFTTAYTYNAASGADATYLGFFRSNVGLRELLTPGSGTGFADGTAGEMATLNAFRFGTAGTGYTALANTVPAEDPTTPGNSATIVQRTDFSFLNQGDAIENQLARRLANPGYNQLASSVDYQFQALGSTATTTLAHQFCLYSSSDDSSTVESALQTELVTNARSTPYQVTGVGSPGVANTWFGDNFYGFKFTPIPPQPVHTNTLPYQAGDTVKPLRSILVGSNPVSNQVYGHYLSRGQWTTATQYHFGDWVWMPTAIGGSIPGFCFVCVQDNIGQSPDVTSTPTNMATETFTPYLTSPPSNVHRAADQYWTYVPWTNAPTKISANTGTFGQLWAAYWNTMYDHPSAITTPVAGMAEPLFGFPVSSLDTNNNQFSNQNTYGSGAARMFRSVIRDPNAATGNTNSQYLTPGQMMLLRSALAALNTESLRSASGSTSTATSGLDTVISRQIQIPPDYSPGTPSPAYNVMLYGATKQPYIGEIYEDIDSTGAIVSIGIELDNPYGFAMPINNWQIARMNRQASTTGYSNTTSVLMSISNAESLPIPATQIQASSTGGYSKLILWDTASGTAPTWLPVAGVGVTTQQVTNLHLAGSIDAANGQEFVILRPRNPATLGSNLTDPVNRYDETIAADLCPVDQIDTTALTGGFAYSYRRVTSTSAGSGWNFVYPGPYSCSATGNPYLFRHSGWYQEASGTSPSFNIPKTSFSGTITSGTGGQPVPAPGAAPSATYPTVSLQVAAMDAAGINPVNATANKTPFGGFARDGDLLQVPFIGSYRITPITECAPGSAAPATCIIAEMNSLPMDSAFADCQDYGTTSADQPAATDLTSTTPYPLREQIGRFQPVGDPQLAYNASGAIISAATTNLDFTPPISYSGNFTTLPLSDAPYFNPNWRYHWAAKLLDFVTVHAPQDDYLPNANPRTYGYAVNPGNASAVTAAPQATANRKTTIKNAQTAGTSEDTVANEGLININTAPYPVLASIPWFPAAYSDIKGIDAQYLAGAIVAYRNTHGPFQNLFDLMKVSVDTKTPPTPSTSVALMTFPFQQAAFDLAQYAGTSSTQARGVGDFVPTPAIPTSYNGPDRPTNDFEKQTLFINRVSNLLTTRSDAFTCYVIVQGWRNVGSSNPVLVAQRRAALILDRSTATANSPTYTTLPISQN